MNHEAQPPQQPARPKRFGLLTLASSLIVAAGVMFMVFASSFTGPWPNSKILDWIAGISMLAFIPTGLAGIVLLIIAAARQR